MWSAHKRPRGRRSWSVNLAQHWVIRQGIWKSIIVIVAMSITAMTWWCLRKVEKTRNLCQVSVAIAQRHTHVAKLVRRLRTAMKKIGTRIKWETRVEEKPYWFARCVRRMVTRSEIRHCTNVSHAHSRCDGKPVGNSMHNNFGIVRRTREEF